jgi:hypothetical protein
MKTIRGLNERLVNLMTNTGGAEAPTYKEVILNSIGAIRGLEPAKVVRLGKLGVTALTMKDSQDFEDADFELIKEVIEKAKIYPDFWVGVVQQKLKDTEFESVK